MRSVSEFYKMPDYLAEWTRGRWPGQFLEEPGSRPITQQIWAELDDPLIGTLQLRSGLA